MENNSEHETFCYTYSAKDYAEIQKIRNKYEPPTEDKIEQLHRLDRNVTKKGTIVSLIVGIIGTLMMGIGMSCTMVWMGIWFVPGIVIGVIGIAVLSSAYPLYAYITKQERKKIAPKIIQITDELMR